MDKVPLNFALLSHWQNWVRILLMVVIGWMAFDLASRQLFSTARKDK